jgi:hypothetical protein
MGRASNWWTNAALIGRRSLARAFGLGGLNALLLGGEGANILMIDGLRYLLLISLPQFCF